MISDPAVPTSQTKKVSGIQSPLRTYREEASHLDNNLSACWTSRGQLAGQLPKRCCLQKNAGALKLLA